MKVCFVNNKLQLIKLVVSLWCVSTQRPVRWKSESVTRLWGLCCVFLLNRARCFRDHTLRHAHLHGLSVHAAVHRGVCLHLQESFLQQEERHHLGERSCSGEWGFFLTEVHDGRFFTCSGWVNLRFGWKFKMRCVVCGVCRPPRRLSVPCPVWECGSQEPWCLQTWPQPRECSFSQCH